MSIFLFYLFMYLFIYLFIIILFQVFVETMRPVSLKFHQNDLLSCEIQHLIVRVSSSVEALCSTS